MKPSAIIGHDDENPPRWVGSIVRAMNRWSRLGWTRPVAMLGVMLLLLAPRSAEALYLGGPINAVHVSNGAIKVDGRPELLWKTIAGMEKIEPVINTIAFNDYSKIVLLQADSIRNANPAKFFSAPAAGSVTMLAAYDDAALYFFFLVKENSAFDPRTVCSTALMWKGNAPEVFIDPAPWNPDKYTAYFSADASGLVFGTSGNTVQMDKPAYPADTRAYFRNRDRTKTDRFDIPSALPSGVQAAAAYHSATDQGTIGVEMKIPYWGNLTNAFAVGSSMFISWGYNHYPDSAKANCDATPIAYRWAKHYKTYGVVDAKPPGWRANDSTHYDPTRSWDGWGQFTLSAYDPRSINCNGIDTTIWDVGYWQSHCTGGVVTVLNDGTKKTSRRTYPWPHVLGLNGEVMGLSIDLRGRRLKTRAVEGLPLK